MVTCFDPSVFKYWAGMEPKPVSTYKPTMTLVTLDTVTAGDLYYRLHSLMMHFGTRMWVEGNVIQFDIVETDTVLAVMSYLNSYLRIVDQQNILSQGMLYSTITWNIPVTI